MKFINIKVMHFLAILIAIFVCFPVFAMKDVSQTAILNKLRVYLENNKRDTEIIRSMGDDGYCTGMTGLFGASRLITTKENANKSYKLLVANEIDDYNWFKSTVELIVSWNGKTKLNDSQIADFERFISLIQFFQNVKDYLPSVHQGELNKSLEYISTSGLEGAKIGVPKKEYSIALFLTLVQLKGLLQNQGIIHDGKLIYITSGKHCTALFKEGNKYYYFDPNSVTGEVQCDSTDEVAKLVFDANFGKDNYAEPHTLGFRIFSLDKDPANYPAQEEVLSEIPLEAEKKYGHAMIMAARIGCLNSMRYFLENGVDINILNDDDKNVLMWSSRCNYPEVVKELLKSEKIKPNIKNSSGLTALMFASIHGSIDVVKELLKSENIDVNVQDNLGFTALAWAAKRNRPDVVEELLNSSKIDPNIKDKAGLTAFMRAAKDGYVDVFKKLLNSSRVDKWLEYDQKVAFQLTDSQEIKKIWWQYVNSTATSLYKEVNRMSNQSNINNLYYKKVLKQDNKDPTIWFLE